MADISSAIENLYNHAAALLDYAAVNIAVAVAEDANKRTGAMAAGVYAENVIGDGETFTCDIVIPAPYAACVVLGSIDHDIEPRNAPHLHFFWEREGKWVTTDHVHHPGYVGNDFFFEPMPDRFGRYLDDAIDAIITEG